MEYPISVPVRESGFEVQKLTLVSFHRAGISWKDMRKLTESMGNN
jgi:hypothetical protein